MKKPLDFLKHIVKDPINTIDEANTRKKEIMPLLYGSAGIIVLSIILQTFANLDFMSIFILIGLIGAGFCGFLLMVINKAKAKFQTLTCNKCGVIAEIKTPEDFAKYISYTVDKDEARFHGYTGNRKPTNGVYSQVKFSGSASAVLSVTLTCPHCGEVKHLKFSADTFKCYAEARKVGALQFTGVSASLETAVKTAISDYNDPNKKSTIPYSFHSSKNPNFENRYSFKGANNADAQPNYLGAIINYHKDIEEILEHYFIYNELTGSLTDPNATSNKNIKPIHTKTTNSHNNSDTDPAQSVLENPEASQTNESCSYECKITEDKATVAPIASTNETITKTPSYECEVTEDKATVAPVASTNETIAKTPSIVIPKIKIKHKDKKPVNTTVIIAVVCALVIIGGIILGINLANKNKKSDNTNTPTESFTQQSETENTTNETEVINVNDYIGYWHIKEAQEKELTIHNGTNDTVNFSLWYSKNNKINNVSAQLENNIASFSIATKGSVVKGNLTFQKDKIIVKITMSSLNSMPVEELHFTELHMSSLIIAEEEPSDSSSMSSDYDKVFIPPMNDVPYLIYATENRYAIYQNPSFYSDYVQMLPEGTFTIVDEEYDANNNLWGKLKSGIGWICVSEI